MIPGGDASSVLEVVLAGDLGLGVWPSPPQCAVTSEKKEMKKEQVKTEEPSVMPTLWPGSLFHLRSEIFLFMAWASTTVRGMHSSVSSVA